MWSYPSLCSSLCLSFKSKQETKPKVRHTKEPHKNTKSKIKTDKQQTSSQVFYFSHTGASPKTSSLLQLGPASTVCGRAHKRVITCSFPVTSLLHLCCSVLAVIRAFAMAVSAPASGAIVTCRFLA